MESVAPRSNVSNSDDESFIILGNSSPQTSLDAAMMESKIMERSNSSKKSSSNGNNGSTSLTESGISGSQPSAMGEDWMSDLKRSLFEDTLMSSAYNMSGSGISTKMAFVGSLESKVTDLINENILLKKSLVQSTGQMKQQFNAIIKMQEDNMKTQEYHKVKFGETKALIEKLRLERGELKNKLESECKINQDYRKQIDQMTVKLQVVETELATVKENCNKLTIEKDALSKDILQVNRVLAAKVANLEEVVKETEKLKKEVEELKQMNNSTQIIIPNNLSDEMCVSSLADSFVTLQNEPLTKNPHSEEALEQMTLQLEMLEKQRRQVILENDKICNEKELMEENARKLARENDDLKLVICVMEEEKTKKNLEIADITKNSTDTVSSLKKELKTAQENLSEAVSKNLEYVQRNTEMQKTITQLSENISELTERLKDVHTITFQPVRYSLSLDSQDGSSEFANFIENVKIYDKTLKELAQYLNQHSVANGQLLENVSKWLLDIQMNIEKMKNGEVATLILSQKEKLSGLKQTLDGYNFNMCSNNQQIKQTLNFLEKIFLDYQQVLRINKDHEVKSADVKEKLNTYDHLVAKVMQGEMELSKERKEKEMLVDIIKTLQKESDERDLLRAQLEVYKTDFITERESRTCLASEKEELLSNIQDIQKRNRDLVEEIGRLRSTPSTSSYPRASAPRQQQSQSSDFRFQEDDNTPKHKCPICNKFLISVKMLEEHVQLCLDEN